MKTKTLLFIALGIGLVFSSCEKMGFYINPSSTITTENRNISNFSGLDVSHAFNVYVEISKTGESIEIEANENLHEYIEVFKRGDVLVIRLRDIINIRGDATLKAYVTAEYLDQFEASGASYIVVHDDLKVGSMYVDLSGASSFNANVYADEVVIDLSGASEANMGGDVGHLRLDASGASSLFDYDLWIDWFQAELSGASDARVTVNERLDVDASGASNVYYRGTGTLHSLDLSGASNVEKVY